MSNLPLYKRNFYLDCALPNIAAANKTSTTSAHEFVLQQSIVIVGVTLGVKCQRFNTVNSDYESIDYSNLGNYFIIGPMSGGWSPWNYPCSSDSPIAGGTWFTSPRVPYYEVLFHGSVFHQVDFPPLFLNAGWDFRIDLHSVVNVASPTYAWELEWVINLEYLAKEEFDILKQTQWPVNKFIDTANNVPPKNPNYRQR